MIPHHFLRPDVLVRSCVLKYGHADRFTLPLKDHRRFCPFQEREMTLMGTFGCGLIGFGPTATLFCLVVARDPLQVILFTLRYIQFSTPLLVLPSSALFVFGCKKLASFVYFNFLSLLFDYLIEFVLKSN